MDVRAVRVATGSIGATGEADITVTFPTAFPDTNYTATAIVEIDDPGESLRVRRMRVKTADSCVVNVVNNAITSRTGTLHVIAIHD
ncbi:MAG: hypothetical protein KY469_10825 [Actinobacteria bacterium]|nr:hypothetical protein [Actinomycetota bacterium]